MATYAELYAIAKTNSDLRNKVTVACLIAADTIRSENPATTNHDNRLIWAKRALTSPEKVGEEMLPAVLAQNVSATTTQINSASDSTIQTAVNNAINLFATGA